MIDEVIICSLFIGTVISYRFKGRRRNRGLVLNIECHDDYERLGYAEVGERSPSDVYPSIRSSVAYD